MLYPHSKEEHLKDELFKNPTPEYRGAPFWSWNSKLDEDVIRKEVNFFREMGIGGFNVHARTGLDTEYMSEEFLNCVKAACDEGKKHGMLCYLYDEDRWPSGYAGGFVTKNPEYRQKFLFFTKDGPEQQKENPQYVKTYSAYALKINDGNLLSYRTVSDESALLEGEMIRWAHLFLARPSSWHNGYTYVDTLSPKAIKAFIEETHEKYYQAMGEEFGGAIPAIFTDEPQFRAPNMIRDKDLEAPALIPFTDDFDDTFTAEFGESIIPHVPAIFWDGEKSYSLWRYRYFKHVTQRFDEAFSKQVGKWCEEHNIGLTGHLLGEESLISQTHATGDATRHYKSYGIPGIDVLCDNREYATAKQVQSIVHQYEKDGMLSEIYGVTGWDFDFKGHKIAGDWQAALGVTVRTHHLSWMSMEGEAKRDYPASIFYQSPWFRDYKTIEDHFARVYTALTRGKPVVRIGVIHPVESYWTVFGSTNKNEAGTIEHLYQSTTAHLINSNDDFNFICEELLTETTPADFKGKTFPVKAMGYDLIVIPGSITLRSTTLERLKTFKKNGGTIVFVGRKPCLLDGAPSDEVTSFAEECAFVEAPEMLGEYTAAVKEITVHGKKRNFIYQLREEKDASRWLFACHVDKTDSTEPEDLTLEINGTYDVEFYDTMCGTHFPYPAERKNGKTFVDMTLFAYDSVLLRLTVNEKEGKDTFATPVISAVSMEGGRVLCTAPDTCTFSLEEKNDLLLDHAEYSIDGGEWKESLEILKLDNAVREEIGLVPRNGDLAQPWSIKKVPAKNRVALRYTFESEIDVPSPSLAFENAEDGATVTLNGENVPVTVTGWYVDMAIKTIALPPVKKGTNVLIIELPFIQKTNLENIFILGDFGVAVSNGTAKIVPLPEKIEFKDISAQSLGFYAANINYTFEVEGSGEEAFISIPEFKNPLITVSVDGKETGRIFKPPFTAPLGLLTEGKHTVTLGVKGNRFNSFGALHNSNPHIHWYGPNTWRSNHSYTDDYAVRKTGILAAPVIFTK